MRKVATLGGGVLLLAWLGVAATEQGEPRVSSAPPSPPVGAGPDAILAELRVHADRLDRDLEGMSGPSRTSRNPFGFAASQIAEPMPSSAVAGSPRLVTQPPGHQLALIGIAEARRAGELVRTAVISNADDLALVEVGDHVGSRHEVRGIGEESVELLDLQDGRVVRLSLR